MLGKQCITPNCTNEQMSNNRYCESCYKKRKSEYAKEHYKTHGKGSGVCCSCGKTFIKTNKIQKFCPDCHIKRETISSYSKLSHDPYHRTTNHSTEHRCAIAAILQLKESEVVHHADLNPRNNDLSNLIIMSRSDHSSYHGHLKHTC